MHLTLHLEQVLVTAGGRIKCRRCTAQSKRTKLQCGIAALKGKTKCGFHGGRSAGPKTPEGRARCAQAKTIHGNDTRADRIEHSQKMAEIRALERLGFKYGFMSGSKIPGRKPKPRG
jgi:hypothetical protein